MPTDKEILEQRVYLADYWREFYDRVNILLKAYHGNYQELWPGEFRRGEVPKIANWIKLAWDRFSVMVGKVPSHHVPPSKLRRISQTKADKIEKILSHYDYASGAGKLAKRYAWWLVGTGSGVIGVMPDGVLGGPRIVVKDPRTVLASPGAGSSPLTSGSYGYQSHPMMSAASLNSLIINETVTGAYLMDSYPDEKGALAGMLKGSNINTPQELVTFMDKDQWVVLVNQKRLTEVEHGLGFVPFRFTTMEVPDQLGGQSYFEQNIGLVLAYIKTLNQKLTVNKNLTWPWLVVKGMNEIDHQARVIEILERDGMAQFLSPPAEMQAERDLDMLDRLIRVLNHDTETMQGEAPGSVVTGSGARELNRDVRNLVLDFWEVMAPDWEFVKSAGLALDEEVWGAKTKQMYGRKGGEEFEEEYSPTKDIKGHRHVLVDFGIGVGGMEGFVELMQTAAQGYADEQMVMENLPWIKSVSDTRKRVLLDKIEKVLLEMITTGGPAPIINHLVAWRTAIQNNKDPYEWLEKNPIPDPNAMPIPGMEEGGMPGAEGEGMPPAIPGMGGMPPGMGGGQMPLGAPGGQVQQPQPVQRTPSPQQLLALVQGQGGRR